MELEDFYILKDAHRLANTIEYFPEMQGVFQSIKELLQLETIKLLCLLLQASFHRTDVYKLRVLKHQVTSYGENVEEIRNMRLISFSKLPSKYKARILDPYFCPLLFIRL